MAGPKRPWMAAGALLMLSLIAGCGAQYRTVVTPVSTSGPPSQINSYAVVVTAPCTNASLTLPTATATSCSSASATGNYGDVTLLNYSGDTIVDQALLGPNPIAFALDGSSTYGHTLNADKTLSSFAPSTNLETKDIQRSTLSTTGTVGNFLAFNSSSFYLIDTAANSVDFLSGAVPAIQQTVAFANTGTSGLINLVGANSVQRIYAISQFANSASGDCSNPSGVTATGAVSGIDTSTNTIIGSPISVGVCPVYGIMSSDGRRVFVLNRGSGTISVIDSQKNVADSAHPTINLGASSGPVYAEFIPNTNYLVTANYDDNSISVVKVGLDVYGNDASDFGTVVAKITDASLNKPSSLTVLADGSRLYVANEGSGVLQSDNITVKGTVSVVNLTTYSVNKVLSVYGSPRTLVSAQDAIFGKVYVSAPDTKYCTIIRTDEDIVSTAILMPGYGVDVRMTRTSSSLTNRILSSRLPGSGQP